MSHNVIVFANLDMSGFDDASSKYVDVFDMQLINKVSTSFTLSLSSVVIDNTGVLTITPNGIDDFYIDTQKFTGVDVYFTIRVKQDTTYFKNLGNLAYYNLQIALLSTNLIDATYQTVKFSNNTSSIEAADVIIPSVLTNVQMISSDITQLSSIYGGIFKGKLHTNTPIQQAVIYAQCEIDGVPLSGFSNIFEIFDSTKIEVVKKVNEDFNPSARLSELRFQQCMKDSEVLFKDLLGEIAGKQSDDGLGNKINESIKNFNLNLADSDTCNIKSLKGMLDMLGIDYDNYNVSEIQQIDNFMNVFTVPLATQKGTRNGYSFNFDTKGYQNNDYYGKNKGEELNFFNTFLYAGVDNSKLIIAEEKYSKKFTLVNTFLRNPQNTVYVDTQSLKYSLSAYDPSWGWGLVLPPDVDSGDVYKYYTFYNYNSAIDGSLIQKYIDYDNELNTYLVQCSSYSDYFKDSGIVDKILKHTMYDVSGLTNIGN